MSQHKGRVQRAMQRAGVQDTVLGRARTVGEYQAALSKLSDRELLAEVERADRAYIRSLSDEEVVKLARGEGEEDEA